MAEKAGNQTPNTPDVSETKLRETKVDELREQARDLGISGRSDLRKEELVQAIASARSERADDSDLGAGPDGGRLRTGEQTSRSLKYSQEVTSPDDEPERSGRSLATTHHEVIKQWAEQRGGRPATVEGAEHGDLLGGLRIDFGGGDARLRQGRGGGGGQTLGSRRPNFLYPGGSRA